VRQLASFCRPAARWSASQAVRLLIFVIRIYQVTLARWLGRECRFEPTCSEYMIQSLRKRGLIVGLALGLWRILRCNPFSRGGNDPV